MLCVCKHCMTTLKPARQEMIWTSVKDYFDKHCTEDARKKCRNLSQKKAWLVKELGVQLQFETWFAMRSGQISDRI